MPYQQQRYAALAVDLFSTGGRVACMFRVLGGMMRDPLGNRTVSDLQDAISWLKARPGVAPDRVGVIGFCMGGTFALALACVNGDVKAASVYYGSNPRPLPAVAEACPIVGSYPEKDFTRKAALKLDAALTAYRVPHDIKIYPGARHGFFNPDRKAHDANAAADSWNRTLAFFGDHLARRGTA
ncbi:MAG: dienelactone hydrolase family protein [Thermoplasmatota archaeon]